MVRPLAGALAALLLAAAALLAAGPREALREAATDLLMRAVPRPGEPVPVLAVAAGEEDLAALGAWPWPRARLAALIEKLDAAGAAAIALDVAFVEAAPDDAALEAALGAAPAVVGLLAGGARPARRLAVALVGGPELGGLLALPGVAPSALRAAPGGLLALPGERVRAVPLLVRLEGAGAAGLLPGLALSALARALEVETLVVRRVEAGAAVQLGTAQLPLPADGMLRLHPGPPVPAVPARAVLEGAAGVAESVRGRVVVFGATAPEAAPLRPSVFGPFTPSLTLQAEAVAQLAAGWVPRRVPGGALTEAGAALLLGLVAAWAVRRRPGFGLGVVALLGLEWTAGCAAALRLGPLLLDPALPVIAVVLAGAVQAADGALRAARERARLMARFTHRLPPGVAERLLALPEAERLRPERCAATVLITDLASFTSMVRRGDPPTIVGLLNLYLAGLEQAVTREGGTMERLLGDGMLAVFGAPVAMADHQARALRAARALDAFAEAFRAQPEAAALGWGQTRIGLAAGEVLVGEVGGTRLTWTVYGDAANVAARLQELAKTTGHRALATGVVDESLAPLGVFELRGRPGSVEVRVIA